MTRPEPQDFADRRALVTGGAQGIGLACARLLAARGARVVVWDVDEAALASACASIRSEGGEAHPVRCDVRDEEAVAGAVAESVAAVGGLDVVHVNAATIESFGDLLAMQVAQWDHTMAVNLRGAYLTARAVLPHLVESGNGVLCFTGSDTALLTCPEYPAYASSKHAIIGLARSIAVDFGGRGVRSNVVTPGVTDSPGLRRLYSSGDRSADDVVAEAGTWTLLGRVAQPGDIAEAVAFVCSDRASFMTGANLVIDGGATIRYDATP